ncbi:hypothetical protein [Novosphingobium sp. HII-3]|uniref:hypothetical protein n=1 Tax=Novosphingobium sp. HII-3 TaxID=2075565 RepID=UPI000CDAECE6|nr:hypothetical protein [Novosphingobium sp. HII-3]
MKPAAAAVPLAPSIGPAIVTIAGVNIPPLALILSIAALLLARFIAPPSLEKMAREQEWALTGLLVLILFLAVTGELPLVGQGEPMGAGMAVVTGIGIGFSGLLTIRLISDRVAAAIKAFFGR